jgi:signal transduction histidine kinase
MGIVAVCIISSALAMVWYSYRDVPDSLRSQLQERGIAIGTSLAAQGRDMILTHDEFALYTLIKDTVDSSEDLVYAFVLDAEGDLMVHSFGEGFPMGLLDVNRPQPGEPVNIQALRTESDTVQDVAISVLGGKAGVVRLGMSEANIQATVVSHIGNILPWIALIFVLGLSVSYGLASILTRPVAQLADAARAVGRGDFRWKAPVWARDEIGSLGTAFNEMSEELRHKEEMRAQLLAKLICAQEEERKRISRELHDETSQSLTSLLVGLKVLEDSTDSGQIRARTAGLRTLAARTLDEVHNLAVELRPGLLDDLGLASAINTYVREYARNLEIDVDLYVNGLGEVRLPSEIEATVYRIVQEALTNIARYAEAKNVSVVLRRRGSSLVTVIEDDGKGFDATRIVDSPAEGKLGLFGMYERASIVGGRLSVESQQGIGTTIVLEVPFNPTQEEADGEDKAASSG